MAERTQFGLELPDGFASADREALEHVLTQAAGYRRRFTYHKTAADWADSLLGERDADASRDVILVLAGEQPVGMVELVCEGGTMTIALLIVAESRRLSGVGRRAVEALVAAVERDREVLIDTLAIGVEEANSAALQFWERLGFVVTETLASARIVNMERWIGLTRERSVLAGAN